MTLYLQPFTRCMAALLVLATICRRPVTLTFDLLTLKSVWESHVTLGTPVQSFVFLGLLVFELDPMYATSDRRTDRQTDRRTTDADHRIMPPRRGHNNELADRYFHVGYLSWVIYLCSALCTLKPKKPKKIPKNLGFSSPGTLTTLK